VSYALCCICEDACKPFAECFCSCHRRHRGLPLEDGTFANCECQRWTEAQLTALAKDDRREWGGCLNLACYELAERGSDYCAECAETEGADRSPVGDRFF
jgi:hypothetical protein